MSSSDPRDTHVLIHMDDLERMRSELRRLKAREEELLASNTATVLENRGLKAALRIAQRGGGSRSADVAEFFGMAQQEVRLWPGVPDRTTLQFRLRLIAEEFFEMLRASVGSDWDADAREYCASAESLVSSVIDDARESTVELPELVDAWIDQLYVIEGALLAFGVDADPVWALVHRANMAKRGGPVVHGKQVKPPGWTPPDIAAELDRQCEEQS